MLPNLFNYDADQSTPAAASSPSAPLVLSYGLGVDSTGVLAGWEARGIRPDLILHAQTSSEKRATERYLAVANEWLHRIGFPEVTEVEYRPRHDMYRGLITDSLVKLTLPSLAFGKRACSQKVKAGPQWSYLRKWRPAQAAWSRGAKIHHALGYDAGPIDMRRGKDSPDTALERFIYPLREWGWDRERCIQEISNTTLLAEIAAKHGIPTVPLKSSCVMCPSMKMAEIDDLVATEPDMIDAICAIELAAMPTLGTVRGLWRKATQAKPAAMTDYLSQRHGIDVSAAARRYIDTVSKPADHTLTKGVDPAARYIVVKHDGTLVTAEKFKQAMKGRKRGEPVMVRLIGEWRLWTRSMPPTEPLAA